MRSPEAIPVEKLATDIEIAYGGLGHDIPARNDEDILEPLQILLATRRGMRADRSLSSLEVPGDRTIVFVGPSGGAVKDIPIWAQVVELLGMKVLISFLLFGLTKSYMEDVFSRRNIQNAGENLPLQVAEYVTAAWVVVLILARTYVKRAMATAIPPSFDPQSYEYRLAQAMQQRGMSYREVVTYPQKKMESICSRNLDVREIFRIEALEDPECAEWTCDILVKFWSNGQVEMQFAELNNQDWSLTRTKYQIGLSRCDIEKVMTVVS